MRKIIAVAGGLLGALAAGVLIVTLSAGSSHREAPSSTRDPQADWTDVYENLQRLARLLDAGTLRVPVQYSYGLDRIADALRALGDTHTQGKLAVQVA